MTHGFDAWIGQQENHVDRVDAAALRRLAAVLDHENPPWRENELPPLGHWLFHLPDARQSELDVDGHPRKGNFLPPIPLPRRMWAGSRVRFLRAIALGREIGRRSTIAQIERKSIVSGAMVLVTVRHEILCDGTVAIEEYQDIVYVGAAGNTSAARSRAPIELPEPQITRRFHATPELLFRFSALTFNAHRIHYDRDYAREVEHHPGLVVHGPLLALLLVDQFLRHRPESRVTAFSFRARAPIFDSETFTLSLAQKPAGADLWICGEDREVRMTARIEVE